MAVRDSELIILPGKDNKPRIYHLSLAEGELAPYVFFVGDPDRVDLVAQHFDAVTVSVDHREYRTKTGTYKDMPVSVVGTGIGTDNNEIALVEAFGVHEFDLETRVRRGNVQPLTIIRLGTSGGPQAEIACGTFAIAQYALGLDNTGMFYDVPAQDQTVLDIEREAYKIITQNTPETARFRGRIHPYASRASPDAVVALGESARAVGAKYVVGITASASGFYAPQGREIPGLPITVPRLQEHLSRLRVDGQRIVAIGEETTVDAEGKFFPTNFEMESSLLFHLGALMGYRTGTICPIIANRQRGTFLNDYKPAVEECIRIGLNAMHTLYQQDQKSLRR